LTKDVAEPPASIIIEAPRNFAKLGKVLEALQMLEIARLVARFGGDAPPVW
jgi:hypothetical protein